MAAPAEPAHYLIVVETSSLLADRSERASLAVAELVENGFKGRMQAGDYYYLWTFSENLALTNYPAQRYDPDDARRLSNLLFVHLQKQRWSKKPRLDRVLFEIFKLMQTGQDFYVYLVLSGEESTVQGTPFDKEINLWYRLNAQRWRTEKCVGILALVVEKGRFTDWAMGVACPPQAVQQVVGGSLRPVESPQGQATAGATDGTPPRMTVHNVKGETQVLPAPKAVVQTNWLVPAMAPPPGSDVKPPPGPPVATPITPTSSPPSPAVTPTPPAILQAAVPQPVSPAAEAKPPPLPGPSQKVVQGPQERSPPPTPVTREGTETKPSPDNLLTTPRTPPTAIDAGAERSTSASGQGPAVSTMTTTTGQETSPATANASLISTGAFPGRTVQPSASATGLATGQATQHGTAAARTFPGTAGGEKPAEKQPTRLPVTPVASGPSLGGGSPLLLLGAGGMALMAIIAGVFWLRRARLAAGPSFITRSLEQKERRNWKR